MKEGSSRREPLPTVEQLCDDGALSRTGEHETGCSSKGTTSGQRAPIDSAIGPLLTDGSGIALDLC
jgi:hypothetical protein